MNVGWHLEIWFATERPAPGVVVFARDPTGHVDSEFSVDQVATLRTNNHTLWLFPPTSMVSVFGAKGRLMTIVEKARCAGFADGALRGLLKCKRLHDAEVALGNTIPVPMVGNVLAPILRMWQEGRMTEMLFHDPNREP